MHKTISSIRTALRTAASEQVRTSTQRFFREPVKVYGFRAAEVKKMAKFHFAGVQALSRAQLFELCEVLLQSGYLEEAGIACEWVKRVHHDLKPKDWSMLDRWVGAYITNWAVCDAFCTGTAGAFLEMYPQHLKKLRTWAKSKNLWMRRAAAVSLVVPARKGLFHAEVFDLAGILLLDSEDMVQKGYGWMLKEAANFDQEAVFKFVMKNKAVMPRTALRYAIEKMPTERKRQAMAKGG